MQPPAPPPPPVAERTAHPFVTHDMIHEIPAAVRETLEKGRAPAASAARGLAGRSLLYFTGCGTAFYSAWLGRLLTAHASNERVRSVAVPAVELSAYTADVHPACGVVGVSHSGITKATVEALRSARNRGARTVGITHFSDRPIAAVADDVLLVGNGPDRSRCHTKCYVSGALGAAMVGLEWVAAGDGGMRRFVEDRMAAFRTLPDLQASVLRRVETQCEELAAIHRNRRATYIVGFGPNEPTAAEMALKLMETSFIAAQGMETEQFIHGPTQSLDSESLLFVIVAQGAGRSRSLDLLRGARTIGAHAVAIAPEGDREVEAASETTLNVPAVDEFLSPFLNIIPLYLYAYYASVRRGHNPDVLRYLDPAYWGARNIVFPPGTH